MKQNAKIIAAFALLIALTAQLASASDAPVVNVNNSSHVELAFLPGIGEARACTIAEEREKAPFTSCKDLERVKGIGPKTAEKMCPHVVFGDEPTTATQKIEVSK